MSREDPPQTEYIRTRILGGATAAACVRNCTGLERSFSASFTLPLLISALTDIPGGSSEGESGWGQWKEMLKYLCDKTFL